MTRNQTLSAVAGVALALMMLSTPASAVEVDFVIGLQGETYLPWEATHETGNGYGFSAFRFVVELYFDGVVPDSLAETLAPVGRP